MRLLDRYLLRELAAPLLYCLAGFLVFWVSFDVLAELENFRERQLQLRDVLLYYTFRLPELLNVILPITLLLALLYALANHNRHNEIVAMRAAGRSLWRLSLPYLGVGTVCSVLLLATNEWWLPNHSARADRILARNQPAADEPAERLVFFNARDNRNWNIRAYNHRARRMLDPRLEWTLANGSRRQILAQSAFWTNRSWVFVDAQEFYYPPGSDALPVPSRTNWLVLAGLSESPEMIQSEIKVSSLNTARASRKVTLSLEDIANYRRLHPQLSPRLRALLETQFHARLASPWTCLVVVLVAVPFGVGAGGRKNVFVGAASSVFIGFTYFILLRLGMAMGAGGKMPGWLAAWLPNFIFAGLAVVLMFRAR